MHTKINETVMAGDATSEGGNYIDERHNKLSQNTVDNQTTN